MKTAKLRQFNRKAEKQMDTLTTKQFVDMLRFYHQKDWHINSQYYSEIASLIERLDTDVNSELDKSDRSEVAQWKKSRQSDQTKKFNIMEYADMTQNNLTPIGWKLASKYPPPRGGRIIVACADLGYSSKECIGFCGAVKCESSQWYESEGDKGWFPLHENFEITCWIEYPGKGE